jgi:hypothetical protein
MIATDAWIESRSVRSALVISARSAADMAAIRGRRGGSASHAEL